MKTPWVSYVSKCDHKSDLTSRIKNIDLATIIEKIMFKTYL